MTEEKVTIYKCDNCEFKTLDRDAMVIHEAQHLGISVNEYVEWEALYNNYKHTLYHNYIYARSIEKFYDALNKLDEFERKHGLVGKVHPIHFSS